MVYLKVLCENFQDDHLVVLATLVLSWVELIFQTVKISHCPFQIVVDDTTKVIPYHLHNKLGLFLLQNEIYQPVIGINAPRNISKNFFLRLKCL